MLQTFFNTVCLKCESQCSSYRWMACGVYPMTTETGKKTEINTKAPKGIFCCSLTPYQFTLRAWIHRGFKVPIEHDRAMVILPGKTYVNSEQWAVKCNRVYCMHFPLTAAELQQPDTGIQTVSFVCYLWSSLLSLHARYF